MANLISPSLRSVLIVISNTIAYYSMVLVLGLESCMLNINHTFVNFLELP